MRNLIKTIVIFLSLALALSFTGAAAGDCFADGAPDGSCTLGWSVSVRDTDGNEQTLTTAEDVSGQLGEGFALDWGAEEPSVADLRRSGVKITPPRGYALSSLLLVAEGNASPEGSSLLPLAEAVLDGSAAVRLAPALFAEDFDASSVGCVFNGSAEHYTLRIELDKILLPEEITLSYTAGSLASELGDAALISGGNTVTLSVEEGRTSVSGTIAAIDPALAGNVLRDYGKHFTGWRLTLPNGSGADFEGGESVALSSSATLEAQWENMIVFSFTGGEKMYDGTPLEGSCSRSGELKSGDTLEIPDEAFTLSRTEVGESQATIDLSRVRVLRGEEDVTGEYKFELIPAALRVVRRGITFTITDVEGEYNGSAYVPSEYTLSSGSLLEGHQESAVFSGRQTLPGESTASAVFQIADAEGRDVTGNYNISVINGAIRVSARGEKQPLTVTIADAEKVYDGTAEISATYSVTAGSLLGDDVLSVLSLSGSTAEVGTGSVNGRFAVLNGTSDVSENYEITVVPGKLTIKDAEPLPTEKTAITVTMKDAEKTYDGTPLNTTQYEITKGALREGDKLALVAYDGGITGVGTGRISASFVVTNGKADVSGNYEITVVPGTLSIRHRALVLTADSAEKSFDGQALTKNSFSISSGTLISGHKLSATVSGSQTEIGSSANKIDAASVKVMDGDRDVTAQYSIRLVDGTLSVKGAAAPTALTITMKSAEKGYDGKPLTSKDYEISSGKLAEGDELVIGTVTGEQTDAGESSVTASFTVMRGKADVTAGYELKVVPGKLVVKQREITITATSDSKIYDGRALSRDSWKLSSGELVKGHKLTASVSGSQTEIGSSANVISRSSVKITDESGKDVTKNYNVTTAAGTLTVSRDPVTPITLSLGDSSKVYDGKPYRFLASDIKLSSGSLPSGYRIEATFNPEAPVDVGKYDVTIKSVTIRNASGADVTSQFNITRAKGSLTITARPLVIETKAANKVYDGKALTERSTPNISGRVDGHQVTLRITGSQTKVGTSDNTVSDVKITDKQSGADVTKNYAISYQYGKLTVSEASGVGDTGADYNWVSGSAGTLFIKFDHSYDGFEGLQLDGKDLDRSAYTSAAGSTEIWLKASYLNTLSAGTHTLKARYTDGESAQASFSVQGTQSTRTGDNSHLWLWFVILAAALAATFAVARRLLSGSGRRWKKRANRDR